MPDVSVIMAVYNGMPDIERALDSLVAQTLGFDRMQVLIADDGSTDGTAAVIDTFAASHASVEVMHEPNSGGPAIPRNLALERVRGRYIFFLDHDDYLSADALAAMVEIADNNGTDVVLARMKGLGGRSTPRGMFMRTVQRTDVFSSPVYLTISPQKLFRTEMVRSLGLRFRPDFRLGEDLPFTASAYLKGDGISILSDKDYIFFPYRDDGSNLTKRRLSLADRMPVACWAFGFVAECVPPGPKRDLLMRRHFSMEFVGSAFEGYAAESDAEARDAAFAVFRSIAADYYNEAIEKELTPKGRVLMRLVAEDRQADFGEFLALDAAADPPESILEDGRIFQALPWFRDPARGFPDSLFDITEQLRAQCRVESVAVGPGGMHVEAECRFGALTEQVTDVSLVLRLHGCADDIAVIPLRAQVSTEERNPFVSVRGTLKPGVLLSALAEGTYDFFIRVSAGDVSREQRVSECAPPRAAVRAIRHTRSTHPRFGTLKTTSKGTLSLEVTDLAGLTTRAVRRFGRSTARAVRRVSGRPKA
jgi:CDP-glycerol glycerophosphotransferase